MKKYIYILSIFFTISCYACEKNVTSEFSFQHNLENDMFSYKINRKDNQPFNYYELPFKEFPGETGFIIENSHFRTLDFLNKTDISSLTALQIMGLKYTDFYSERGSLNSTMLIRTRNLYEDIPEERNYLSSVYFKKINVINKSININKFLIFFTKAMPENDQYGKKKIKLKVKLLLDPNLKECVIFEVPTFEYDLGSNFWFKIKQKLL